MDKRFWSCTEYHSVNNINICVCQWFNYHFLVNRSFSFLFIFVHFSCYCGWWCCCQNCFAILCALQDKRFIFLFDSVALSHVPHQYIERISIGLSSLHNTHSRCPIPWGPSYFWGAVSSLLLFQAHFVLSILFDSFVIPLFFFVFHFKNAPHKKEKTKNHSNFCYPSHIHTHLLSLTLCSRGFVRTEKKEGISSGYFEAQTRIFTKSM